MRRREFIASGLVLGAPLTMPGLASAMEAPAAARWLVSQECAADPLAHALADAGASVTRAPNEAAVLWFDHVAPALDRGQPVHGITSAGSSFLVGRLAHLRGRFAPSRHMAALVTDARHEAWEILPRLAPNRLERKQ